MLPFFFFANECTVYIFTSIIYAILLFIEVFGTPSLVFRPAIFNELLFIDLYDELHNPSVAAVAVLASAAKRKDVLQPILQFVLAILNSPDADARDQDGALRLIGELSSALIKNKVYCILFY